MDLEVLAHCSREGMVEQGSSHHGGQEAEKGVFQEKARKRYRPQRRLPLVYFFQIDSIPWVLPPPNNTIIL